MRCIAICNLSLKIGNLSFCAGFVVPKYSFIDHLSAKTYSHSRGSSKAHIIQPRFFPFLQILRVSRDSQFSPPSERCASDPLLETLEARETVDLILDVMFR